MFGAIYRNKGSRELARVVAIAALIVLMAIPAWSHKVKVFAFVEGRNIFVEGYFGGKVKAQNCKVEVLDETGKKLQEGTTDTQGKCSFKLSELPPFTGGLVVVLHAGSGHRAQYTLASEDLPTSTPAKEAAKPQPAPVPAAKAQTESQKPHVGGGSVPGTACESLVVSDQLRRTMEQAIDARIEPLVKMLGNQQRILLEQRDKGPTFSEIIGGIGWIFGIVGVVAYMMSRRRRDGSSHDTKDS